MWRSLNLTSITSEGSSCLFNNVDIKDPAFREDISGTPTDSIHDIEKLCVQDSFETNPTQGSTCRTLSTDSSVTSSLENGTLRLPMQRESSMISVFVNAQINDAQKSRFHLSTNTKFYFFFLVLPTMVSLLFASAILFPPEYRQRFPLLFWTNGALIKNEEGKMMVCPRDSICSEGAVQLILLFLSRATAFASYTVLGITFLSKMHCLIHWLSCSHISTFIPFESLHQIHKRTGTIYFIFALSHTAGHFVRWFIRHEILERQSTQVGISGLIGILAMICVVLSMSPMVKVMASFETRLNAHYLSLLLAGALCFHTGRCRIMTLIFVGLWSVDYIYGYLFKIHRLDIVEFTPLPYKSGVQMLWHNPKGFRVKSGEYVKIKLPWLSEGGSEWHAFSIYMHEATEQGLKNIQREKTERRNSVQVSIGNDVHTQSKVDPTKTALILIEIQNEFASPRGKLHNGIKSELYRTGMIGKTVMLADVARNAGAHIFHVPLILNKEGGNRPNNNMGYLKDCRDNSLFMENTWNAEIINDHKPRDSDIIVEGKKGLDSFSGTNLEDLMREKGIETVIVAGMLTNCSVESTMRTAYEKGYNVITLTDGAVCNSKQAHRAATEGTFKMFSTPMSCQQAAMTLKGKISVNRDAALPMTTLSSHSRSKMTLEKFTSFVLTRHHESSNKLEPTLIMEEARKDMHLQYETTQVFIAPSGDWTKRVSREIADKSQLRSCWVRGPYTSPYAVASNFNHLVLVASGIGITPALGVMGQYSGSSRSKFLVWTTRCPHMLKFFAPLLKDAHVAAVYYTGTKYVFTEEELAALRSYGNIHIETKRPKSMTAIIESLIVTYEQHAYKFAQQIYRGGIPSDIVNQITIDSMDEASLRAWCVLYCGGSQKIKDILHKYTKEKRVTFECEKFGW